MSALDLLQSSVFPPSPRGSGTLGIPVEFTQKACEDLTVSNWASDGLKPGSRQGEGRGCGVKKTETTKSIRLTFPF